MKYKGRLIIILLVLIMLVLWFILKIREVSVREVKTSDIKYCNINIDNEGNVNVNESIRISAGRRFGGYEIELFPYVENEYLGYIEDIKVFVDGEEILSSEQSSGLKDIDLKFYYDRYRVDIYGLDYAGRDINIQYKISSKMIEQYNNLTVLKAKANDNFLDYKIKINFPSNINLLRTDIKKAEVNKIQNNCYEIDMTKTNKMISKNYVEIKFDKDIVKEPTIINKEYNLYNQMDKQGNIVLKKILRIALIFTILIFIPAKILTKRRIIYKNSIKSTKVVLDPIFAEYLIDGKIGNKELIMSCIMDLIYRKNIEVADNNIIKIKNMNNITKYERKIVDLVFEDSKITSFEKLKNIFNVDGEKTIKFYKKLNIIKNEIKEYFFEEKIYSQKGKTILMIIQKISLLNIMIYAFFAWIFLICGQINSINFLLSIIISILNVIIYNKCKISCLTNKGVVEYNKVYALKKYIKEYSLMEQREIDGIQIWDRYLAYACAFGISTKIIGKVDEGTMKANILYQSLINKEVEYIIE